MNNLPDEIEYKIFDSLGNPKELNNLRLVCKTLNKKIFDFQDKNSNMFIRLKKYFRNPSYFLMLMKKMMD